MRFESHANICVHPDQLAEQHWTQSGPAGALHVTLTKYIYFCVSFLASYDCSLDLPCAMVFLSHIIRLPREAHRLVHHMSNVYNQIVDFHTSLRLISTLANFFGNKLNNTSIIFARVLEHQTDFLFEQKLTSLAINLAVIRCILGPHTRQKAFSPFTYLSSYCGSIVDQPSASFTSRSSRQTPFMVRILTGRMRNFDSNPFCGLHPTLTPQILQNR